METRIELAEYFNKLGFKLGAEIGVADGRFSEILCDGIDGLKLICVDPWAPYEKCWRNSENQDEAYARATKRLEGKNVEIVRKTSIEASLGVEDRSLDFVFIDGSHTFDNVMVDIILWSKKVKIGGIIALHDYCHFTNSGIIEAVNKYCEVHRIEISLINRNNNNHKDDRQPSVFWVNK